MIELTKEELKFIVSLITQVSFKAGQSKQVQLAESILKKVDDTVKE